LKGWYLGEELILKSKGESGVQGASFMAVSWNSVGGFNGSGRGNGSYSRYRPLYVSMFHVAVNMIGNGVATLAIARWEKEIDKPTLRRNL